MAEHLRFKLDPGYRIFGRNVSLNFGSSSFSGESFGRHEMKWKRAKTFRKSGRRERDTE